MTAQVRAELLKLRSTRSTYGLLVAMLGLVVAAVVLHGYGLGAESLDTGSRQLTMLVGWGAVLGALFAGLLGALSFTSEVRYGTIRPTLLVTPQRGRVVVAKSLANLVAGLSFGLMANAVAAVAGSLALTAWKVDVLLDGADFALLIAGGAVAAALWAVIGVGVGALVRSQVPTVVGLLAWVLFVEGQLLGNVPTLARLAPAAAGQSVSGMNRDALIAPASGAVLLVLYAAVAGSAGWWTTTRRDFV